MRQPRLIRIQIQLGPSLFSAGRSATLWVDWGEEAATPRPAADLVRFWAAILTHPSLAKEKPQPELGAIEAADPARRLERVAVRLAIVLQRALGHDAPSASEPDEDVPPGVAVVPIWDVDLGILAAQAAFELVAASLAARDDEGSAEHLSATTATLDRFFAAAGKNGFSEGRIRLLQAADRRGLPWCRLVPGSELIMLGQGARQRRLLRSFTPATSHLATQISTHKDLAAALLRRQGLPVPANRRVTSVEAALSAAAAIGFPVVVKPTSTDFGTAVSLEVRSESDLRRAYVEAATHGAVLIEQQIPGDHTRLLVMHGRFVSAVRQDPAEVIGDGRQTVAALIAAVNVSRTTDLSSSFKKIAIDDEARLLLGRHRLALDDIPAAGRKVRLRHTSNTSRGGTARNVTALVHPDNARLAERAAAIVGLDVAGVDLIMPDIERSFREVGGAICEVNPTPGFYMREPGFLIEDAFLDGLFAGGDRGRIPIVCLLAPDDDAAATLMAEIGKRLDAAMAGVALVQPGGVRVGDWAVSGPPPSLQEATRQVLADPATQVAVIHLTYRAIIEGGLGFDACDVALLAPLPPPPPDAPRRGAPRRRAAGLLAGRARERIDVGSRDWLDRIEDIATGRPRDGA